MSNTTLVYRVQGADGRGPWKPGLSKYWAQRRDLIGHLSETVIDLCGGLEALAALPRGWHYGCACRTKEQLASWFTEQESITLAIMGYFPTEINADKIVVQSDYQSLIACRKPFNVGCKALAWAEIMP